MADDEHHNAAVSVISIMDKKLVGTDCGTFYL